LRRLGIVAIPLEIDFSQHREFDDEGSSDLDAEPSSAERRSGPETCPPPADGFCDQDRGIGVQAVVDHVDRGRTVATKSPGTSR
jgi:hypothetical protein